MATELLPVPEEKLAEVIAVIRAGLTEMQGHVSDDVVLNLNQWCDDEEEYLKRLEEE